MNSFISKSYALLRRGARSVIIRSPLMDRLMGDRLRNFERRLPVDELCQSLAADHVICHGLKFNFPPDDISTVSQMLLYNDYEPETREVVQSVLHLGDTFIDLGANIGYFSLIAARVVGASGKVFAFEPIPATNKYLRRNVEANACQDVVTIVQKAVADESKRVRFTFDSTQSVSAKIQTGKSVDRGSLLELDAISLDEFFAAEGWPKAHLIKMDIEGAEIAALRGMTEVCRRNPDLKLIFEFLYNNLDEIGATPEDLFAALRDCGFGRFTILYRHEGGQLLMPQDLPRLLALAKRVNVNILAERG